MRPIHVLHVLNSASGGSAISTFDLIRGLAEQGINSSLVCFNNASAQQQKTIASLVNGRVLFVPLYWTNKRIRAARWKRPLIELKAGWETWFGYKHLKSIDQLIRDNGVTLVHTSTMVNAEGALAAKRNHLPHVWHVRELVGPGSHYQFRNYQRWAAFVNRHADIIVANSQMTASNVMPYLAKNKVVTIPNGIDLQGYKIKHHQPAREVVVGMIGNVTSELKNHSFFIEVAARLQGSPGVKFRIYGALPQRNTDYLNKLRAQISRLGANDSVEFAGFRDSPRTLVAEMDILFHPMGLESFGRIFIEAMAGGLPIVAVKGGGALELVHPDSNGYLVDDNNVEQAVNAITALIREPQLRNEMGKRGRQLVEENYTLETYVLGMKRIYEQVLNKQHE